MDELAKAQENNRGKPQASQQCASRQVHAGTRISDSWPHLRVPIISLYARLLLDSSTWFVRIHPERLAECLMATSPSAGPGRLRTVSTLPIPIFQDSLLATDDGACRQRSLRKMLLNYRTRATCVPKNSLSMNSSRPALSSSRADKVTTRSRRCDSQLKSPL